ncbi:MAG TPA: UbiA family prenyltransferase [Bacteroidia bacterium]|nr:UbiA family prenyltransferase [Bacteroidia bacterium]
MPKALGRFSDFLFYSNIFLAFSVTSLVFETSVVLNAGMPDLRYPFFLFFSTLFLYSFHRIFRFNFRAEREKLADRHIWVKNNRSLFYTILFLSGACSAISAILFIPLRVLFSLLPVAFVSFAYTIPCVPWKGKLIRLRDVPGLKIFLISLVLGLTTVLLPVLACTSASNLFDTPVLFVFFRRMFFIFAITIPFDIRDSEYDRKNNVQTLPVVFGERASRRMALAGLGVFALLVLLQLLFVTSTRMSYAIALLLSAAISARMIVHSEKTKRDLYYSFNLEGMMLLQCILVAAAYTYAQ